MINLADVDWATAVKVLVAVAGAVASYIKLRSLIPPSRMRLKADLEILKLLDPSDEASKLVRAHTLRTIRRLYAQSEPRSRFHVYDMPGLISGLFFLVVFSIWTVTLAKDSDYWWAVLTGFFAFAGLGSLLSAFDPKSAKAKSNAVDPNSAKPEAGETHSKSAE